MSTVPRGAYVAAHAREVPLLVPPQGVGLPFSTSRMELRVEAFDIFNRSNLSPSNGNALARVRDDDFVGDTARFNSGGKWISHAAVRPRTRRHADGVGEPFCDLTGMAPRRRWR